ncbi:hypothetical protein [Ideonella sp.]|uniref:hypothetical protein n=1 Tax=Ideonella sp. TaxID=1929293 RepID=UPI0035B000DF
MSNSTFLDDARGLGVRDDIAQLVHETLVRSFRVKNPSVQSDLYKAFGMVDDELDLLVVEVAVGAKLRLPSPTETFGQPAVRTVKDLLLFLNRLPSSAGSI